MKIDHLTGAAGVCLLLLFTASTHAALIDNGNGLIYDDDLGITWLADANYAMTSGYDADGLMTWDEANTWANQLVYGGHDQWRLPMTVPCSSNECVPVGGELHHLFYDELSSKLGQPIQSSGDPDLALFSNIQGLYWSTPERDSTSAWYFDMSTATPGPGEQTWAFKTGDLWAWAVADGNISDLPVPAAIWLFASGLLGLIGVSRRS